MREPFFDLAGQLARTLRGDEVFTAWLQGEDTDFVRFNHARVRQPGSVRQGEFTLTLIDGERQAQASFTLSGAPEEDRARASRSLDRLREAVKQAPVDPYISYSQRVTSSDDETAGALPDTVEMAHEICAAAAGMDLVGVLASGPVYRGFANSLGQRNWFSRTSFNLDWSVYHAADKAVKSNLAGFEWQPARLVERITSAREQLAVLEHPERVLAPGTYDAYLAPEAMAEIVGLLGWGGFGMRAHRTRTTPLIQMQAGAARFADVVTLAEDTAGGAGPRFDPAGFVKPARIELVRHGALANLLCSARSAREFDAEPNAAGAGEHPEALAMAPGTLAPGDEIAALGTGLLVTNLWYLNYSDRNVCRMTGMTRFATLWIENGRPVAPVEAMRFDESLYRLLGDKLVDLGAAAPLVLSTDTYGGRGTSSQRVPGALVRDLTLTL